jgi:cyclopropane fatty-acyl-phospholipid synthase-like methyltransferase
LQAIDIRSAIDFYERHPISADIIRAKLTAARGHLDNVAPDELLPHDQDHYGGLAANDALAQAAQLKPGESVVDFCAGLAGPARYYAQHYGVDVTGIELTPVRVRGANDLTRLVGLQDKVRVIEANVMAVPLADASVDAVLSQEALLHVPDKARALAEAHRILKAGGRLAFTDWVTHRPLSDADARLMWQGMAVTNLLALPDYVASIEGCGFALASTQDLTAEWAVVLKERLAMYLKLRGEAEQAKTAAGHDAFYESYVRLVALVQEGALGGARFAAVKRSG